MEDNAAVVSSGRERLPAAASIEMDCRHFGRCIQSTLRSKLYNKVQDRRENNTEQRVYHRLGVKGKILL